MPAEPPSNRQDARSLAGHWIQQRDSRHPKGPARGEDLGGALPAVKEGRDAKATSLVARWLTQLCAYQRQELRRGRKPPQAQASNLSRVNCLLPPCFPCCLEQGNTPKMGTLLCVNGLASHRTGPGYPCPGYSCPRPSLSPSGNTIFSSCSPQVDHTIGPLRVL